MKSARDAVLRCTYSSNWITQTEEPSFGSIGARKKDVNIFAEWGMSDINGIITDYKPRLYDLHRHFENYTVRGEKKLVVGNYEARMITSLLFPIRGTSMVISGLAGSGKTTIIKGMASLVWGDEVLDGKVKEVFYIAGSSDKGFITDTLANRIANVCTHCVIPELQNAISNERVEAIIKLWTEKESYQYVRGDHGGRISREIILHPLPILTSIATENKYRENLGEEMERRFFPLYTAANKNLNTEIHKAKANFWMKCDEDVVCMSDAERTVLRHHLQDAMQAKRQIRNPSAGYMQGVIPSNYVVSNSMIDYWFELVASITQFYYPDRMTYFKGDSNYLLSSPSDNFLAWKLGGGAIVMASLNIPALGSEIINLLPIRDSLNLDAKKNVNEIIDALQGMGIELKRKQVGMMLRGLESVNYARRDDHSKEEFYKTQDYNLDRSVNWRECIEETKKCVKSNQEEIARDYIRELCDDPVVEDPFTGKKIKLLDIPYEKPAPPSKKKLSVEEYF